MTVPEWIDVVWKVGGLAIIVIGGIWAVKQSIRDAKTEATAASEAVAKVNTGLEAFIARFDEHELALRKRLEDQDRNMAVMKRVQEIRDEEASRGLSRIENSITALQTRMEMAVTGVHQRLDRVLESQAE